MIIDASAVAARMIDSPADPRSYLLSFYPQAPIPPLDHVVATAEPLVARVNHGVWIASCSCGAPSRDIGTGIPNPGCVVFLERPLGWCVRCGNRAWGGGWRPITVLTEEERSLIEAVLDCRPSVGDRNWEPGETVEMLVAENAAHGDPVPDLAVVRIGPLHGPSVRDLASPFPPPAAMRAMLAEQAPRRGLRRFLGR